MPSVWVWAENNHAVCVMGKLEKDEEPENLTPPSVKYYVFYDLETVSNYTTHETIVFSLSYCYVPVGDCTELFDEEGNETTLDYQRLITIVKDAGYTGFIGVEYEGERLNEEEGIVATKSLLEKIGASL